MENLTRVYDFLQGAGYYFLLTVDENGYPKGRAFTSKIVADGKLYLVTGKAKRVFAQLQQHPKIELLAYQMKQQQYLRVDATAIIEENPALVQKYLEKEPQVRRDFEGDAEKRIGLFYLKDATAELLSLDGTVKETFSLS